MPRLHTIDYDGITPQLVFRVTWDEGSKFEVGGHGQEIERAYNYWEAWCDGGWLGGHRLTRDAVIEALGLEEVQLIERQVSEKFTDSYGAAA